MFRIDGGVLYLYERGFILVADVFYLEAVTVDNVHVFILGYTKVFFFHRHFLFFLRHPDKTLKFVTEASANYASRITYGKEQRR